MQEVLEVVVAAAVPGGLGLLGHRRLAPEGAEPFGGEGTEGIADGLGGEADGGGDLRRGLAWGAVQEDLAAAQGEGVGGAQALAQGLPLGVSQGPDEQWCFHPVSIAAQLQSQRQLLDPALNRDQIETRSFRFVGCGYTIRRYSPDKEPQRGNVMVRVEMAKWGQCLEDLRRASLGAAHPRTRERFQALYLIASGQFNATSCALHVGRHDETVLGWVHRYNAHGPAALAYRRSGGRAPLLTSNKQNRSLRPSRTPSRPTTACPAITGR